VSVDSRRRKRAALADSEAREFLRRADPVLARAIDGHAAGPQVLRPSDLALRHAVQRLYGLDHLPTEHEMLDVAERWRPYRSLAVGYLFGSEFDERSRPSVAEVTDERG
jgi:hypothetical protein